MSSPFSQSPRLPASLLRALGIALLTAGSAHAAASDAVLQHPCALLDRSDYALVLPAPSAALQAQPYTGRRSSECLWTDAQGPRTLRLVLHSTRDSARPLAQLERLRAADPQALPIDIDGRPAVLSGDRSQLSVAVGSLMLSLIGSSPLQPENAQALAAKLITQLHQQAPQP